MQERQSHLLPSEEFQEHGDAGIDISAIGTPEHWAELTHERSEVAVLHQAPTFRAPTGAHLLVAECKLRAVSLVRPPSAHAPCRGRVQAARRLPGASGSLPELAWSWHWLSEPCHEATFEHCEPVWWGLRYVSRHTCLGPCSIAVCPCIVLCTQSFQIETRRGGGPPDTSMFDVCVTTETRHLHQLSEAQQRSNSRWQRAQSKAPQPQHRRAQPT